MTEIMPRVEMTLSQVYLEHCEFSHRGDPLTEPSAPKGESPPAQISVNLMIADDQQHVAVRLQVDSDDPKGNYLFSLAYVALFTLKSDADLQAPEAEQVRGRMMVTGATIAMPFARELVGNLSGRGRHATLWLNPINFAQHLLKKENQGQLVPPTL